MKSRMNSQGGFTIVELLIVIVVIAILAAITVVAFNGLSDRSYAAKAESTVDGYSKAVEMYKIDHGSYPAVNTSSGFACIGEVSNYPAGDGFDAGQCSDYGDEVDSALNEMLRGYVSSNFDGSLPAVDEGDSRLRGIIYAANGDQAAIMYLVNGDQQCPRGEEQTWREGTTACVVELGEPGSGSGGDDGSGSAVTQI